jgi:CheY-like chemotaxis protein
LEPQTSATAKHILLVDDDPVVVHIYEQGLTRLGFRVSTATDGLAALRFLKASQPDVVVVDLMMPKFSGAEVLRFIRSRPGGERMPVIILSNAYMDPRAHEAADMGAHGLLKVQCTPASLALAINELIDGKFHATPEMPVRNPTEQAPPSKPISETLEQQPTSLEAVSATPASAPGAEKAEPEAQAQAELAKHSPALVASLRESYLLLLRARDERERKLRLEVLYRQVHFVTGVAGLARYQAISQMAGALEALLFGLMDKPAQLSPSLERTLSQALDYLRELLGRPQRPGEKPLREPLALVVDDDKFSNRLVVTALRNAHVQAKATDHAELALNLLQEQTYDLVLLDIEMPGMDGIELCKRLRAVPSYVRTPVIHVTLHSDFDTRARTLSSGGTDFISKPVVPAELAVKAVMHLLKHQSAAGDI